MAQILYAVKYPNIKSCIKTKVTLHGVSVATAPAEINTEIVAGDGMVKHIFREIGFKIEIL